MRNLFMLTMVILLSCKQDRKVTSQGFPGLWTLIDADSLTGDRLRGLSQRIDLDEQWTFSEGVLKEYFDAQDTIWMSNDTFYLNDLSHWVVIDNTDAQTLTATSIGDSLTVSGGNSIMVPHRLYGVDSLAEIYTKSFPLGATILHRTNMALYKVQSSAVAGYTTDSIAVIPTGGRYAVLQDLNGAYDIRYFGAVGDGVVNNTDILTKASLFARGEKVIIIPPGIFRIDSDFEIPDQGIVLIGTGISDDGESSTIYYVGSGSAIKLADDFTSGSRKIRIENLRIAGTSSAQFGVDFGISSVYGAIINNVEIEGFTGVGAYAIDMDNTYNTVVSNCRIQSNDNGILIRGVCQANVISNSWIVDFENYGIHVDGIAGRSTVLNTIIDAPSGGYTGLIGIYQDSVVGSTSGIRVNGCHLEDNYQNILVDTGYFWMSQCIQSNPSGIADSIADGVTAFLDNLHGNTSTPMKLGIGTTWNRMTGRFTLPTVSGAGTITAPSTIIEVNNSSPTNLNGFTTTHSDRFEGEVTLRFMDANTTLLHNSGTVGRLLLQGSENWNPQTGDYIVLKKYKFDTGTSRDYFVETGRYSTSGEVMSSKLTGGSSTTSDLTLQTTTAAGTTGADMHFLVGNNGATEAMTILNSGNVGIGNSDPGSPLDVVSGFPQIRVGSSTANSTNKNGFIGQIHYNTAEQDLTLIRGSSTSSSSIVYVGGGTSLQNAATQVSIYTAGNTITTTGTERVRVRSNGEVSIGSTTDLGADILQVTGDVYIDDVLTLKPTSAPGTPAEGMIYMNSSDHHLYVYNGTTWVQLDN